MTEASSKFRVLVTVVSTIALARSADKELASDPKKYVRFENPREQDHAGDIQIKISGGDLLDPETLHSWPDFLREEFIERRIVVEVDDKGNEIVAETDADVDLSKTAGEAEDDVVTDVTQGVFDPNGDNKDVTLEEIADTSSPEEEF